ncbi:MAG: hypothetical protein DDT35_01279 [Firmicutes bacterium]|nr:hypothetical protein [Bacillota bacterium]
MTTFTSPVRFTDTLTVAWDRVVPLIPRSNLEQSNLMPFTVPMTDWKVWDAMQTDLPGVSAADDLALIGGLFGTGTPTLQTWDVRGAGGTGPVLLHARTPIVLPHEYVAGQTVIFRVRAGMLTTAASLSATVDLEVFHSLNGAVVGGDICHSPAQTINSVGLFEREFLIDSSGLSPGDTLDVRLTLAIRDTATTTVVRGFVGLVRLLCDVR